jgi:hypothetical protein
MIAALMGLLGHLRRMRWACSRCEKFIRYIVVTHASARAEATAYQLSEMAVFCQNAVYAIRGLLGEVPNERKKHLMNDGFELLSACTAVAVGWRG